MKETRTSRGFELVELEKYGDDRSFWTRLVQQSSIVGGYDDSFDRPGSSALWVGEHHHLDREQVLQLVEYLVRWVRTGHLF